MCITWIVLTSIPPRRLTTLVPDLQGQILQLSRQLIDQGPVSIGRRPGRRFETCMMYELEKMWISESTQLCMDMADKSTYGDGRGHICRAFHVGYSTTGHGSTETNSPNNPSQSDRVWAKNDYHRRTRVCILTWVLYGGIPFTLNRQKSQCMNCCCQCKRG